MTSLRPVGPTRTLAAFGALAVLASTSPDYTVREGDTLSEIAVRHGTSVSELAEANAIADADHIVIGRLLRLPVADSRAASPAGRTPARDEAEALLTSTARAHGWSPAFVKALAWQESGWNNGVVSSAGAIGIMQVLPGTGEFVSRELAGRTLDLHDPADNVLAGVLFLDYLYDLTDGDAEMTLAGYYQGLRSVRQRGVDTATERYIANVLALRERFR